MRLIDADALRAEYQAILDRGDMFCEYDIVGMVDNAPTVTTSLKLENITEDDIEKFKMIWQRATSKGLLLISEDVLYREESCDRKTHCTDYEYWHCIGCNGCKRREASHET